MNESSGEQDKKPVANNNLYNSSNNTDSGITARVFQSILKFMQNNDTGAYVILTSNDVSQLPPEFTRTGRLDSQWFFSFPNAKDREEIAQLHLKRYKKKISENLLSYLVNQTANFTGAEIAEVVNNVMRHVFLRIKSSKKYDITYKDLKDSIAEVTPVFESNKERVNALRTWVKGRARFTNGSDDAEEKENAVLDPLSGGISF